MFKTYAILQIGVARGYNDTLNIKVGTEELKLYLIKEEHCEENCIYLFFPRSASKKCIFQYFSCISESKHFMFLPHK